MATKETHTCEYCESEFNVDDMFIIGEDDLWFCDGCFQLVNPRIRII